MAEKLEEIELGSESKRGRRFEKERKRKRSRAKKARRKYGAVSSKRSDEKIRGGKGNALVAGDIEDEDFDEGVEDDWDEEGDEDEEDEDDGEDDDSQGEPDIVVRNGRNLSTSRKGSIGKDDPQLAEKSVNSSLL